MHLQRKAVVQRCRDKLCKKSFYPTAQQIEHEAKAMAKEEAGTDKAPPELQRKIARLVRPVKLCHVRMHKPIICCLTCAPLCCVLLNKERAGKRKPALMFHFSCCADPQP